jgi:hypothetical protein
VSHSKPPSRIQKYRAFSKSYGYRLAPPNGPRPG